MSETDLADIVRGWAASGLSSIISASRRYHTTTTCGRPWARAGEATTPGFPIIRSMGFGTSGKTLLSMDRTFLADPMPISKGTLIALRH